MLNLILFSKLPYDIKLILYVSLLTYSKKKTKFNIILREIELLSNMKLSNISDSNLYYENENFVRICLNRLSIENMLFINSIYLDLNILYGENNRFILLYDDEIIFREIGNLKIKYFRKNKIDEYIIRYNDSLIFNKNELGNSIIRIETLDGCILADIDYDNYIFQNFRISFIKEFDLCKMYKRYFKRVYFKRDYNVSKNTFTRTNKNLSSYLNNPRYEYLLKKTLSSDNSSKKYYKYLMNLYLSNI